MPCMMFSNTDNKNMQCCYLKISISMKLASIISSMANKLTAENSFFEAVIMKYIKDFRNQKQVYISYLNQKTRLDQSKPKLDLTTKSQQVQERLESKTTYTQNGMNSKWPESGPKPKMT